MTTLHFEDSPVMFKNFAGRAVGAFPPGKRYFHIQLPREEAERLQAEGWLIKKWHELWLLCVHIDDEYDTPVAQFDELRFDTAEIFIEGRTFMHARGSEGISARLISITPKQ